MGKGGFDLAEFWRMPLTCALTMKADLVYPWYSGVHSCLTFVCIDESYRQQEVANENINPWILLRRPLFEFHFNLHPHSYNFNTTHNYSIPLRKYVGLRYVFHDHHWSTLLTTCQINLKMLTSKSMVATMVNQITKPSSPTNWLEVPQLSKEWNCSRIDNAKKVRNIHTRRQQS